MAKLWVLFACEECDACLTTGFSYPEGYCTDLEEGIVDIGKFHADCKLDDAKPKQKRWSSYPEGCDSETDTFFSC